MIPSLSTDELTRPACHYMQHFGWQGRGCRHNGEKDLAGLHRARLPRPLGVARAWRAVASPRSPARFEKPPPLMFSFFRKKNDAGSPWETQRMPDVAPAAEPPAAVPLPVSVDYDSDNYACYALTIPSGVGCDGAINGGSYKLPGAAPDGGSLTVMLDPKYYYFCDGRRSALTDGGASMSYVYCTPNSALVAQGLTQEVLDTVRRLLSLPE